MLTNCTATQDTIDHPRTRTATHSTKFTPRLELSAQHALSKRQKSLQTEAGPGNSKVHERGKELELHILIRYSLGTGHVEVFCTFDGLCYPLEHAASHD